MMRLILGALVALFALTSAFAQGGMAPGPGTVHSTGAAAATYTPIYGNAQDIGFGASSYTSPSQTWVAGEAVVCVIQAGSSGTLSSFTIKGVTATQIGGYTTGNVGSLWQATVTAGSGTVSFNGSASFGGIGTAGGVVTTTTTTPSAPQLNAMGVVAEPQPLGASITVPANGAAFACGGGAFGSAAALPLTWASGGIRDSGTEAAGSGGGSANAVIGAAHIAAGSTATPTLASSNGTFAFAGTSGAMMAVAYSP